MIELYLDEKTRTKLLEYDLENTENCYDRNMYYITNPEHQILYDIIFGLIYNESILEEIGFKSEDIKLIGVDDVNIYFTNKSEYYIKEVEL